MHLLIESDGGLEGTVVKDADSGEPVGLVKSASWNIDRLGNLTRLEIVVDESVKAQKSAVKLAAKAEKDAAKADEALPAEERAP